MPPETLTEADRLAQRSFAAKPGLSLLQRETATQPAEYEGRRHLKDAYFIELRRIQPDPAQPRRSLDASALKDLADSIEQMGVLQPITVQYLPDAEIYQIISGERRFQAAKAAGLTEIPCWVQDPEERHVLVRQVVENWQRADLHPFEIADSLGALRDRWRYTQADIAHLIGKSKGEVSKFLSLLTLDEAVAQECRGDTTGTLTRKHLEALSRAPREKQDAVLHQVKQQHLTAQQTEQLVRETASKRPGMAREKPKATPGKIFRFATMKAVVSITFRRTHANTADVLEALDAARRMAAGVEEKTEDR